MAMSSTRSRLLIAAAIAFFLPLVVGIAEAADHTVTIDATALDYERFQIGSTTYLNTQTHTITLAEGTHNFRIPGGGAMGTVWPFDVDSSGKVQYGASLEDFFDGDGTSTLTAVGYDVTIDATALAYSQATVKPYLAALGTASSKTYRLMPNSGSTVHMFEIPGGGAQGTNYFFQVDANGKVQYDASMEDFFDGDGTSTLTAVGFDITIDATALSYTDAIVKPYLANVGTASSKTYRLMPNRGSTVHLFEISGAGAMGASAYFQVDEDGHVAYDSGLGEVFSGTGTDTLTITGCDVTIDPTGLDAIGVTEFTIGPGLGGARSTASNVTLTLMTNDISVYFHRITADGAHHAFTVGRDCYVHYDASEDGFFGGRGTATLELKGNQPPTVDAEDGFAIYSSDQSTTVVKASASDPDGDDLEYRWIEKGGTVLLGWTDVVSGSADLDLGTLSTLSLGSHCLQVEVRDEFATSVDQIVIEIDNSPPECMATGQGVFECGETVTLAGEVADFDGDELTWTWRLTGNDEFPLGGTLTPASGGAPSTLPDTTIASSDLGVGTHTIELAVDDGENDEVVCELVIVVVDTTKPLLSATSSRALLWPPNHKLQDVTIDAVVSDACDDAVHLSATVSSSEPPNADGDGNVALDWTEPTIDQSTGEITLQLRSERQGKGDGRVYTITITATDASGNSSVVEVLVRAPHDRKALDG